MNTIRIGAVILAAGKGKRMKTKGVNKVVMNLANKPMILHTVELLEKLKIQPIIVVIGFAKQSVISLLGNRVIFTEQKKRLGTAHALSCALDKLPTEVTEVLVLNGDDSAFYTEKIVQKLMNHHKDFSSSVTLLTIEAKNPFGLGRILRNDEGKIVRIVEEADASEEQKKIHEVNPACYLFQVNFLKKYLKKVKKSKITGEYYVISLIELGIQHKEKIETVFVSSIPWRGVNTKEELREAEKLFSQLAS